VVISDNCTSGAFDFPQPGFAESILRMSGGGAVGVFAFTRGSNNAVGRRLLEGVVDALWPDAYPSFGDGSARPRLGDMLNHARARIAAKQAGGDPATSGYQQAWAYVRMLTLFGDPTLEVWMEYPSILPDGLGVIVDGPVMEFVYPLDGAVITAVEETERGMAPIGRAVVVDGAARTRFVVPPRELSEVRYYATRPGGIATALTAEPVEK
jgi:hypothetical protein